MAGGISIADGIVSIIKPPGMTSHDVVSVVRRILGEKKTGHCGTLDPQAAGVLPVCVGTATRLADYVACDSKSYYCEMLLGWETDTQDAWGEKTAEYPVPSLELEEIRQAAKALTGSLLQEVPVYSAVKKNGQALYKQARQGVRETGIRRPVRIYALEVLDYRQRQIRFHVHCGKGTYVRMLCRDLARLLGTGGHMTFLLRTQTGAFNLENSVTLEELAAKGRSLLLPKELAVASLAAVRPGKERVERIRQGQSLWLEEAVYTAAAGGREKESLEPEQSLGQAVAAPRKKEAFAAAGLPQAAAFDSEGRLAALGFWTAGWGPRQGQGLFKPVKVFQP